MEDESETGQTMSVPDAGRRYLGLGRSASYRAADRGDLPTIGAGKKRRVPIRTMEAILDAVTAEALQKLSNRRAEANHPAN